MLGEVEELRSQFTRTFELSDGSHEVRVFPEPVGYPVGDRFELVDTSVVPADGEPGVLESRKNAFGAEFASSDVGVTLVLPSGKEIVSRPAAFDGVAPAGPVEPVVDPENDSVVWYPQVWPGVDLRYTVSAVGLREDVVYTEAPSGSSAVSFSVSGAELDPVWESPAPPEAVAAPATGGVASPPERVEVPAPSSEMDPLAALVDAAAGLDVPRSADLESGRAARRERLKGLRNGGGAVDRPAEAGARSSLEARGEVGAEVDFGQLAVASGEGEDLVVDPVAKPLARSRVVSPGESLVEYSVDDSWIKDLPSSEFPVVLDPDLTVFSNGWRVYFNVADTECGSGSPWCWPTVGWPNWPGYPLSTWRTVIGFDLSSVAAQYELHGAGSSQVLWTMLRFTKEAGGAPGDTAVELAVPSAWSWAGAIGGGGLGSVSHSTNWNYSIGDRVRSTLAAGGSGLVFGVRADPTSSVNYKQLGAYLSIAVNPNTPAPMIADSAPPDGKSWYAPLASSAPLLAVDEVVDDTIHPSFGGQLRYHFSVATTPPGVSDYWGGVASRESQPSTTFQLDPNVLVDGKTYYWRAWTNDGYGLTPGPVYSFRFDRRLGVSNVSPMQSFGPMQVNVGTGNLVFGWSSRSVNTVGGSAAVAMTYNSLVAPNTSQQATTPGLPAGWTGGWGELPIARADIAAGGSAVIRFTDGSKESFHWDSKGAWVPDEPEVQFSTLTSLSNGGYRWSSPSGLQVEFDSSGNIAVASTLADDRQPSSLTYQWSSGGKLLSVTDPVTDRKITLAYGGSPACPSSAPSGLKVAASGMMCSISHMDGSKVVLYYVGSANGDQLARIVEDANGDLSSGDDDQSVTDLSYETSGRVSAVRSPQTNRLIAAGEFTENDSGHVLEVAYDSAGRVTSVSGEKPNSSQPRPRLDFGYDAGGPSVNTVTDANRSEPNGFTARYHLDSSGRAYQVEDRLGRSTYTMWKDAHTNQVLWTDQQSLDAAGQTQFLRSATVYDHRSQPVEQWGPAPRSEFGATTWNDGFQTGQPTTPKTTTTYDGGLGGLSVQYWDNANQTGMPAAHGYLPEGSLLAGGAPDPAVGEDGWSARLSGSVRFGAAGSYTLHVAGYGPVRAVVGGSVVNLWSSQDPAASGGSYQWARLSVDVDAGEAKQVVIDTADSQGTGGVQVFWEGPSVAYQQVPGSSMLPEFGLVTRTDARVSASESSSTAVSYDDPSTVSVDETYLGIPRVTTVDPDGQSLQTIESFEPVGEGKFLRRLSRQLPSGAGSKVTYDYYSPSEGPLEAVCGVGSDTPQLGFIKQTTQADPDGAGPEAPLVRQYVYDAEGRQVGYRASTGVAAEPWSCTGFDDAGRVSEVSYPAWGGQPARTVGYDYAVDGDPLVGSVTDENGTVKTTMDWSGRTVSYSDVWNMTTSTTYDDLGRVASRSNAGGTVAYSYGSDDQVTSVELDGKPVATPAYDSMSRLTGVTYPAGDQNAGNGTSGVFAYDDRGLPASMSWLEPGGASITSDAVTGRDLLDRVTNYSTDGFDVNGAAPNYSYDSAGRLVTAVTFGATPAAGAPARTTSYAFAPTGGCGLAPTAGANGNRSAKSVDGVPVNYCYDHADRLTGTDDPAAAEVNTADGTLGYDSHGNTSRLAQELHGYDVADRHLSTGPAPVEGVGTDALLMVGDPASLKSRDVWMKSRLEGAGWSVTAVDDDTVTLAEADSVDLVVVADSTKSVKSAVIKETTAGVVSTEAWGWDDMKLASSVGSESGLVSVDVVDPGHEMAAGKAGTVTTSVQTFTHGWGTVGAAADVVATKTGDPAKATIFAYDQGDTLVDSTSAQGRRVGWFYYGGHPSHLSADANDMFDAAVLWAGTTQVPASTTSTEVGSDALLMVGDPASLKSRDVWMKSRLEGAGWSVAAVDDDTVTLAEADGVDLVVVAESTKSVKSAVIKETTAGVVSTEAWGWDDMKLASSVGSESGLVSVDVVDPGHELAAGKAGTVTTSVQTFTHGWGSVGAAADVVATRTGDPAKATIFAYDQGDTLVDSTSAQGRRVGWFYYGGHPSHLSADANDMFDAAVLWAGTSELVETLPTVSYTRDATDRIVARSATGEDTVRYGHTGAGDAPQVMLNTSNQVTQVTLGLPGGGVLHLQKDTPGDSRWSYPNLQGTVAAQADANGVKIGSTFVYDPDGIPVAGGLPDTRPGEMDDAWLGGHARPLEHAAGLQPVIEMGARQYHPILARFLEVDPIESGVNNDYGYVDDPVNGSDLSGAYEYTPTCSGLLESFEALCGHAKVQRMIRTAFGKDNIYRHSCGFLSRQTCLYFSREMTAVIDEVFSDLYLAANRWIIEAAICGALATTGVGGILCGLAALVADQVVARNFSPAADKGACTRYLDFPTSPPSLAPFPMDNGGNCKNGTIK